MSLLILTKTLQRQPPVTFGKIWMIKDGFSGYARAADADNYSVVFFF